jgi:hypothetical protein
MSRFSLPRLKNLHRKKDAFAGKIYSTLIGLNRYEREVWVRETVLV